MSTSSFPEPIRGALGASSVGPRNIELDRQNPDLLAAPDTDFGSIPNLKFSFSLAHNRLLEGGWAREVTMRELPAATSMAGVNMRLGPGVVRELHWHKEAEWAFILNGKVRVTLVDSDRNVVVDDLREGDMWLFPAGFPHSIQGLEGGAEFLLVFDDGNFSENQTLLITEWCAHTPRGVLAKNFGIGEEHFVGIPKSEKYIFPLSIPPPLEGVLKKLPDQRPPSPYTYHASAQQADRYGCGSVKIVDVRNFPATTLAAALIELEPGAMREMHWHPKADEWQYYLEGEARMTVFDATSKARTFNYRGGDVGFVPRTMGHYIENVGSAPLRVLNVFNGPKFEDISLNQWMALTPPDLVRGHLNLDATAMDALRRTHQPIVR
jgi:oxalate decarboxylase